MGRSRRCSAWGGPGASSWTAFIVPSLFMVRARVFEERVVGLTGSGLQYIVVDPAGAVDLADHIDGHPGAITGGHGDVNAHAGHGSRRPDPRDVRPPRGIDDQDGLDARLGRRA